MIRAASAHPALPAVRDMYARRTRAVRYQSQSPSSLQPANLRPTRQARRINRRPQAAGHRSSFMPDIDKWPQPLDQMRFRKTFYYFFHAARNRITGLSRHLHHLASIEVEPVTFFQSVRLMNLEYNRLFDKHHNGSVSGIKMAGSFFARGLRTGSGISLPFLCRSSDRAARFISSWRM